MSHQSTSLPACADAVSARSPGDVTTAGAAAWIANGLLAFANVVLMTLACASAWLSYHAQVAYVLAHNGGQAAQARVWALLLDAGTTGVSLLRLYETLRGRRGSATRISLHGCIAASVTMNLLHTPSRTAGGYLVAAVPPVMYAVFLEHLLTNVRGLLIGEQKRRGPWRAVSLWINFPGLMWSVRRGSLRREAQERRSALESDTCDCATARLSASNEPEEVEQGSVTMGEVAPGLAGRSARKGRGLGAKRLAFEAALAEQARSGDLRLFSTDERERNAAAYQAAASLPAPLSPGTARRYVVEALTRLDGTGSVGCAAMADAAPEAG